MKIIKNTKNKTQFVNRSDKTIPITPMPGIERFNCTTKAGNTLSFFYNPENDLVVIDLIAADDAGGNEIVRMTLDERTLLGHLK